MMIVRDGGRFLTTAIESVLGQSRPVHELIVVDGDSKDDTRRRARAAGAVVVQQPGTGTGNARNHGIALATGRYVAFLDHDDIWLHNKLARQLDALQREPAARFAISMVDMKPIDANLSLVHPNLRANASRGAVMGWTPSTFLAERALFDDIGMFDEELEIGSDMDFFARLIDSNTPGTLVRESLVIKQLHCSNLSTNVRRNASDLMAVVRRSVNRRRKALETP